MSRERIEKWIEDAYHMGTSRFRVGLNPLYMKIKKEGRRLAPHSSYFLYEGNIYSYEGSYGMLLFEIEKGDSRYKKLKIDFDRNFPKVSRNELLDI